jgi:hypothetical protein
MRVRWRESNGESVWQDILGTYVDGVCCRLMGGLTCPRQQWTVRWAESCLCSVGERLSDLTRAEHTSSLLARLRDERDCLGVFLGCCSVLSSVSAGLQSARWDRPLCYCRHNWAGVRPFVLGPWVPRKCKRVTGVELLTTDGRAVTRSRDSHWGELKLWARPQRLGFLAAMPNARHCPLNPLCGPCTRNK